jgi:hypothetical protein
MKHKKRIIQGVRNALYWPVEHLSELPGGPLRYMWLIRLVVKLDAPLRRAILGGAFYAKSPR